MTTEQEKTKSFYYKEFRKMLNEVFLKYGAEEAEKLIDKLQTDITYFFQVEANTMEIEQRGLEEIISDYKRSVL